VLMEPGLKEMCLMLAAFGNVVWANEGHWHDTVIQGQRKVNNKWRLQNTFVEGLDTVLLIVANLPEIHDNRTKFEKSIVDLMDVYGAGNIVAAAHPLDVGFWLANTLASNFLGVRCNGKVNEDSVLKIKLRYRK
jgi:hypothetical protein